jgi:hypothetical protein
MVRFYDPKNEEDQARVEKFCKRPELNILCSKSPKKALGHSRFLLLKKTSLRPRNSCSKAQNRSENCSVVSLKKSESLHLSVSAWISAIGVVEKGMFSWMHSFVKRFPKWALQSCAPQTPPGCSVVFEVWPALWVLPSSHNPAQGVIDCWADFSSNFPIMTLKPCFLEFPVLQISVFQSMQGRVMWHRISCD